MNDALVVGHIFLGVGDLQDSCAFVIQLTKELNDFFALAGVQISGRLVESRSFASAMIALATPATRRFAELAWREFQVSDHCSCLTIDRITRNGAPPQD